MPQMSPLPWILLFITILISLFSITSYIYFLNHKQLKLHYSYTQSKFNLMW